MAPQSHLDRRNPLILDVQELKRTAGAMRQVERTVPAPADLGIAVIGVPEGTDVHLDLQLESVVDGIWVSGTVASQLRGECVRCLTELNEPGSFTFQEMYFYPSPQVGEDESLVVDEAIDLEEPLRAAVVLELPFAPVCKPDCLGLCPECGFNLNDDPSHNHGEKIDSRWEGLRGLKLEDN